MKRILITMFILNHLGNVPLTYADMIYDPVLNVIFSKPESSAINQLEYLALIVACGQIEANITAAKSGHQPSKKEVLPQFIAYLRTIGTSTASRLISDFEKNKIFYANGSVMRKIWER